MNDNRGLHVLEISRMATHNGPGIRTMIHFKGCDLNCAWCSTPESRSFEKQLSLLEKKCVRCGACAEACPEQAIAFDQNQGVSIKWEKCVNCFKCAEVCCSTAFSVIGQIYSAEELYHEIIKDRVFYKRSGGGVTFSGGEALLHVSDELMGLLERLKQEQISIGFDTAGHVKKAALERVIPYTEFFLWDVKLIDDQAHKKYTGKGNEIILSNLRYVDQMGKDLYLRCPIITGINDNDRHFQGIMDLANQLKSLKEIHFLPFHRLGTSRYHKIGLDHPYHGMKDVSRAYIIEKQQAFIEEGYIAKIIG